MADGVTTQTADLATIPDATVIATDDAGAGGHVQLVKLAVPTNGSATPWGDASDGLPVEITNASVAITGSVTATSAAKSRIQVASAGLSTSVTAYDANDQMGNIMEFTNAVATSGGYGTIIGATLLDKARVTGAVSLYLFDRSVTLAGNAAAASVSDADMEFCVGIVEFPPPTVGSASAVNSLAQLEPLAMPYKSNATSLWGGMVTRSAHTFFGAATDLVVSLTVETS
jgi:hypothetical protein